jgi:hypothetical protein
VSKVSVPIFHAIAPRPQESPVAHLGLVLAANLHKRHGQLQNVNNRDQCPEVHHDGNIGLCDTFDAIFISIAPDVKLSFSFVQNSIRAKVFLTAKRSGRKFPP